MTLNPPTNQEIQAKLAILEYHLIITFRPTFLHITNPDPDGDVQVIISCAAFKNKNIQERIQDVFKVINKCISDIINDRLIIVQAYDSEEMTEILGEIFQ